MAIIIFIFSTFLIEIRFQAEKCIKRISIKWICKSRNDQCHTRHLETKFKKSDLSPWGFPKIHLDSNKTALVNNDYSILVHQVGPPIARADGVLTSALDRHFSGKRWHFIKRDVKDYIQNQSKALTRLRKTPTNFTFLDWIVRTALFWLRILEFFFCFFL